MCEKQQEPMSVKIVAYSSYTDEPMTFTSDGRYTLLGSRLLSLLLGILMMPVKYGILFHYSLWTQFHLGS